MAAAKTVRWLNLVSVLGASQVGLTPAMILTRLRELPDSPAVTLRTVQRDLNEILDSGLVGLLREETSGGQCWRIDRSFRAFRNYDHLSLSAALTLKMAIEHAAPLLPLAAQAELRQQESHIDVRLKSDLNAWVRPWSAKVRVLPSGHQLGVPEVDKSVIAAVYEALAGDWQLKARYSAAYGGESERVYHPLALVLRPPRLQLIVSTSPNLDPFVLALHRIRSAEVVEQRVEPPAGFDLDRYIASGEMDQRHGGPIRLRLRCTASLAKHWRDAALGANQRIEDEVDADGETAALIEATCTDTAALRAYLLGLGTQVEVLGPEALRDWCGVQARALARRYRRVRGGRAGE